MDLPAACSREARRRPRAQQAPARGDAANPLASARSAAAPRAGQAPPTPRLPPSRKRVLPRGRSQWRREARTRIRCAVDRSAKHGSQPRGQSTQSRCTAGDLLNGFFFQGWPARGPPRVLRRRPLLRGLTSRGTRCAARRSARMGSRCFPEAKRAAPLEPAAVLAVAPVAGLRCHDSLPAEHAWRRRA